MFCRPLRNLLLGIVATLLCAVPALAQGPGAPGYKEDVLGLSKWIDDYLERRWKELDVTPAPLAEDAIFFRRLNLDLIGKIPELVDVQDYLGNPHDTKRWNAIERCLNNEAAARHFANFWRTIIIGRSSNQQFQFFYPQFEAWLEDRIKKNTPLDQITTQILTAQNNNGNQPFQPGIGPGGAGPTPQCFFVVNEGKAENLAGSTARVFMGVKIECAQCHKHPFAKWTREQFWEFAAFYSGQNGFGQQVQPKQKQVSFVPGREIVIPEVNKVVKAKFLNGKEPQWGAFSDSRKVLAEWVTSSENPYFARAMADHLWAYIFGISLLEPILEPNDDSPITHPELLDKLAQELVAHKFDAMYLIRALVHTKAYQRSSGGPELATKEDYHLFLRMPIRSLTPEQIYDSIVVATHVREQQTYSNDMRFNAGFPFGNNTPRGQFLAKFGTQERRYDPQTSILQALFMMNGKFMTERTKAESNEDIITLAKLDRPTRDKLRTMYYMLLSRPPRAEEIQRLLPYVETGGPTHSTQRAIEDIYWALLNSPEFLLNH
jgi:Protein of unknown function (DUF1553)/Protein of unknown function (DUF1549)